MLSVTIPDKLATKIVELAKSACQTPEEFVIELIRERLDYDSPCSETACLTALETDRK
jgi:metal-responsive CopG/Arc/MetJ family transcriptional regulator